MKIIKSTVILLILLCLIAPSIQKSYNILQTPQNITAVTDVTSDVDGFDSDITVAIGYDTNKFLILSKPFIAKKMKVQFTDIDETVQFVLNIPKSKFAIIFFNTKFVAINVEDYFVSGDYGNPYNVSLKDYEIQQNFQFKYLSQPNIAYEEQQDGTINYYMQALLNDGGQQYNALHLCSFTSEDDKLLNFSCEQKKSDHVSASYIYYDNAYGFVLAYGYPNKIFFYHVDSDNEIGNTEATFLNGQITTIDRPPKKDYLLVSDDYGRAQLIDLPTYNSGLWDSSTIQEGYKLFDGAILGTNAILRVSFIGSKYFLYSGGTKAIQIVNYEDTNEVYEIDVDMAGMFLFQKADYLDQKNGYIAMQNFDNKDMLNIFPKQFILYNICDIEGLDIISDCTGIPEDSETEEDEDSDTGTGNDEDNDNDNDEDEDEDEDGGDTEDDGYDLVIDCGYNTYYNGSQCQKCPDECNYCDSDVYFDYGSNKVQECKSCDQNGQCICRQDFPCNDGYFFQQEKCECVICELTECGEDQVLDKDTCSCVNQTCANNINCAECDSNGYSCLVCTADYLSAPECLCYLGNYYNHEKEECLSCPDNNCVQCSGENGEVCQEYAVSGATQSITYPFIITSGVITSYAITFAGVKLFKAFALRKSVTGAIPGAKINHVFPEYANQTNQQLNGQQQINNNNNQFDPDSLSSVGEQSYQNSVQSDNSRGTNINLNPNRNRNRLPRMSNRRAFIIE